MLSYSHDDGDKPNSGTNKFFCFSNKIEKYFLLDIDNFLLFHKYNLSGDKLSYFHAGGFDIYMKLVN
jgi:predicted cupin superfamily sugar epimerase